MEGKKRINFTPSEKNRLLCVVGTYKHIVENKCTKATITQKKVDVWKKIADDYNCGSETGPRTVKQLKALYDNLKRSTRKSVADTHHANYLMKINEAKQVASNDKNEIMKTGGGSYEPALNKEQELLLAEIMAQVTPLSNVYDSAALYFDEAEMNVETCGMPEVIPIIHTTNTSPHTSNATPNIPVPTAKNPNNFKRKSLTAEELRRQFYQKKIKTANLEYKAKKKIFTLEIKRLALEIKKLEK